jgi:peptidoglycan/xylan/chitin deacetylase (PgdA/CDA1 family)
VVRTLLDVFKSAPALDVAAFLEHLGERADVAVDAEILGRDLFMTWDEIREMARSGMAIGSHTHTHPILARLSEADQFEELSRSKRTLERELGRPVEAIAYPVGDPSAFTPATRRLARDAGYQLGFSFYGGVNRPGHTDLFDMRRIPVEREFTLPKFRSRVILHNLIGRSFG